MAAYFGCRLPLIRVDYVEAYPLCFGFWDLAFAFEVWVVDRGLELQLWWLERIFGWESKLKLPAVLVVRSSGWCCHASPNQNVRFVNRELLKWFKKNYKKKERSDDVIKFAPIISMHIDDVDRNERCMGG